MVFYSSYLRVKKVENIAALHHYIIYMYAYSSIRSGRRALVRA